MFKKKYKKIFFFISKKQFLLSSTGVKSINCVAANADWTVISNCAELTLIPAQLFPVGFSSAELTLIPAQSFPVGFSCAEKLYNCTTFQHTKNRLEMTVQELKLILHSWK